MCVCIVDMDDEELAEAVSGDPFGIGCGDVLTSDLSAACVTCRAEEPREHLLHECHCPGVTSDSRAPIGSDWVYCISSSRNTS